MSTDKSARQLAPGRICRRGEENCWMNISKEISSTCAALAAFVVLQAGCSNEATLASNSDDLSALRAMVRIPEEATSGRWEVFGTPEYKGGTPGPTDFITLVAELESSDALSGTTRQNTGGGVAIVPEAARPWLSTDFRNLLKNSIYSKNSELPLSKENSCQPYQSTMTKSNRPVSGFVCARSKRSLIYLTLQSN